MHHSVCVCVCVCVLLATLFSEPTLARLLFLELHHVGKYAGSWQTAT